MRLILVNNDSEVLESWDLQDWDLHKSIAKTVLIGEIIEAMEGN